MKVHLATAYPTKWTYLPRFESLAKQDRFGVHELVEDPDAADIILFVDARHEHGDWRFRAIASHPLTRAYREKCFVYNETDQPWCFMPGIYVSMPKQWFNRRRMAAWSYIGLMNPYLESPENHPDPDGPAPDDGPDLLFSFSGRRCVPVRDRLLQLEHPRGRVEDTSSYNFFGSGNHSQQTMDERRRLYARLLRRSKFILSPRGSGPASFRLFEALVAGRVPVIVSDEWMPPDGPDWDACSIRVPEADVASMPALLEQRETDWPTMACAARRAWEEWFASDVQFHRIVEACRQIGSQGHSRMTGLKRIVNGRRLWLEGRQFKSTALQPVRMCLK